MRNPLEDRVGNNSDGCGRYAEALERFIVSNHEQSLQVHQMNEEREDNKESIAHEKVRQAGQHGKCSMWTHLEVKINERKKEDEDGIIAGIEQIMENCYVTDHCKLGKGGSLEAYMT